MGGLNMPLEKHEPSLVPNTELPVVNLGMPNSELPQHQSECLFQGHRELIILHNNETYRLRITKTDKLILTK